MTTTLSDTLFRWARPYQLRQLLTPADYEAITWRAVVCDDEGDHDKADALRVVREKLLTASGYTTAPPRPPAWRDPEA